MEYLKSNIQLMQEIYAPFRATFIEENLVNVQATPLQLLISRPTRIWIIISNFGPDNGVLDFASDAFGNGAIFIPNGASAHFNVQEDYDLCTYEFWCRNEGAITGSTAQFYARAGYLVG